MFLCVYTAGRGTKYLVEELRDDGDWEFRRARAAERWEGWMRAGRAAVHAKTDTQQQQYCVLLLY